MSGYAIRGKRVFDVLSAAVACTALAPLAILIAIAIRLEDGPPILFRQTRLGRGGRPFEVLKFRSMPIDSKQLPSDAATSLRVTRVGRLLRRTNIDEMPQLLNILRGDMSLVGPRPPLPDQTELILLRSENGALALRPGLTGLAQVNSFDGMTAAEKARWDGVYADHVSFSRDMKVILKTLMYLRKPPPAY